MVSMSVRCFLVGWWVLMSCGCAIAQATTPADSLFKALSQLPDRERVTQTNKQFYQLYSADFERAIALGESVLATSKKSGWQDQEAAMLKNLGIVHYLRGNHETALDYYQRSLSLFEKINDPAGQGTVCNELAIFFKKRKETDRALAYLDRSAKLCGAASDSLCLSTSMDNRGLLLLENNQLAAADSLFRKVAFLRRRLRDSVGLSYVYNNLAEVALKLGRIEASLDYLGASTEIRRQLGDRQGVAININNAGEALMMTGAPERAIPFFRQSLKESRAIHFNDLSRHTLEMLANACREIGDFEAAYDWLQQSYALKDSLFDAKRSAQIADMQEKYETEQKGKALLNEQLRVRQRTLWLVVAIAAMVLLTIVSTLAIRQYRQQRQQLVLESALRENLLQQQKESALQTERLRISRDLHDHLGAELTLIRSAIARRAYLSQQPEEKAELNALGDNARRAMEELRETVWAIGGEAHTVEDIALRLQDFSARLGEGNIEVTWPEEAGAVQLNSTQTLHLYRIAQEAVNNALKHAPQSAIGIVFGMENQRLVMEISDSGPGFDTTSRKQGYGLRNMQERAQEVGAACSISSTDEGVKVRVVL